MIKIVIQVLCLFIDPKEKSDFNDFSLAEGGSGDETTYYYLTSIM